MYSHDELFLRSPECYFYVYFPHCFANQGNKHKNNLIGSAETVRHLSTYIILYLFNLLSSHYLNQ